MKSKKELPFNEAALFYCVHKIAAKTKASFGGSFFKLVVLVAKTFVNAIQFPTLTN